MQRNIVDWCAIEYNLVMETKNISASDKAHFDGLHNEWWNRSGALRTLHAINPIRLAFIVQHTKGKAHERLLDVGCGGGILAESLAQTGFQVSGIDVNQSAIDVANAHAQQQHLSIDYHCGIIEDYQAQQEFSVISCMEMLEHVPEPASVITHCARLLAPGGMLFVSTLNRTVRAFVQAIVGAEYILQILPKGTHEYKRFLQPSELATMGEACGLLVKNSAGIAYNPITQHFYQTNDVGVNYMLCFEKT